uniref:VanZ-like domain-containing protein n=1 Tax=Opuntia streptacantha TaxID=393608 RepID=A0A7C9AFV3_OPUST
MEEREDPWTAPDKVYHVLFCFSLTILFSLLAGLSPHPFLRRRRLWIAAFLSLSAGAAKEFADHLGFFHSSGASARDAVADAVGVFLALPLSKFMLPRFKTDPDDPVRGIALV